MFEKKKLLGTATKLSLGPCSNIHETNLLSKYQASSSYLKVGYERKLQRVLEGFVKDIQVKIKYNEERLVGNGKSRIELKLESRLETQKQEIDELVNKIEILGNEGKIEECQLIYVELEEKQKQFNYDKVELERLSLDSAYNKDLVCKICGAYTSKTDLKNSDENHISGKTHSGYVKINEVLEKLSSLLDSENENLSDDTRKYKEERYDRNSSKSYSSRRSRDSSEYVKADRFHYRKDSRHHRSHKKEKSNKYDKQRDRSYSRESSRYSRNYYR